MQSGRLAVGGCSGRALALWRFGGGAGCTAPAVLGAATARCGVPPTPCPVPPVYFPCTACVPQSHFSRELREFNLTEDCPVIDGLWQYCQVSPQYSSTAVRRQLCGQMARRCFAGNGHLVSRHAGHRLFWRC